jgi:hypothetical protein
LPPPHATIENAVQRQHTPAIAFLNILIIFLLEFFFFLTLAFQATDVDTVHHLIAEDNEDNQNG